MGNYREGKSVYSHKMRKMLPALYLKLLCDVIISIAWFLLATERGEGGRWREIGDLTSEIGFGNQSDSYVCSISLYLWFLII